MLSTLYDDSHIRRILPPFPTREYAPAVQNENEVISEYASTGTKFFD